MMFPISISETMELPERKWNEIEFNYCEFQDIVLLVKEQQAFAVLRDFRIPPGDKELLAAEDRAPYDLFRTRVPERLRRFFLREYNRGRRDLQDQFRNLLDVPRR